MLIRAAFNSSSGILFLSIRGRLFLHVQSMRTVVGTVTDGHSNAYLFVQISRCHQTLPRI